GPWCCEAVGMRRLAGRGCPGRDTLGAPRVAVINETTARYYFGRPDPIGQRFGIQGPASGNQIEIVGVVKDAKHDTVRDQDLKMIYLPYEQGISRAEQAGGSMRLAVRAAGDPL